MQDLVLVLGRKLKEIRKEKKMVLATVAQKANVTTALISKIENGRTIPSLFVLIAIVEALEEDLSNFFRGIMLRNDKNYFVIKKAENTPIDKETSEGFQYDFVFNKQLISIGFEVVILTIQPKARREATTTDAFEFKYMLEGTCSYIIGDDTVEISEGDSLFFDGRIPHNPQNDSEKPSKMLVMYFFIEGNIN